MRILFVSDNAIYGHGGGCIENRKHYDALKTYCESNSAELKVISLDKELKENLGIVIEKNRKQDAFVRALGHSSYLYFVWEKNIDKILKYKPDIVFLGRSRLGFIAKSIKRKLPECKVITNIDNVEWDYVEAYFAKSKGIKGALLKKIERFGVKRDEEDCIKYSDNLIFLTRRNIERYKELYNYHEKDAVVLPICMEDTVELEKEFQKKTVIFIGSLDYEANILAANKLIQNIWAKYFSDCKDMQLIIAGRNPGHDLIEAGKKNENVKILGDFSRIEDIVPKGALMVAPIEKGAGMKVKVAETLSMGLMIAASDEALVGYEKAVEKDKMNAIIRANSDEEFTKAIEQYRNMENEKLKEVEQQNKRIFKELYSYKVSRTVIEMVCDQCISTEK